MSRMINNSHTPPDKTNLDRWILLRMFDLFDLLILRMLDPFDLLILRMLDPFYLLILRMLDRFSRKGEEE